MKKTGRVSVTVTDLAEAINVFQQVVKGIIVLHLRSLKKATSSVNPALHIWTQQVLALVELLSHPIKPQIQWQSPDGGYFWNGIIWFDLTDKFYRMYTLHSTYASTVPGWHNAKLCRLYSNNAVDVDGPEIMSFVSHYVIRWPKFNIFYYMYGQNE